MVSRPWAVRPVTGAELVSSVVDVAGRSDWQSSLVYSARAPGFPSSWHRALITWSLWGFVAYLFGTWWLLTHRVDRFWLPLSPSAGGARGTGGRLGAEPRLVDPPGHARDDRTRSATFPTSRRPWPA